MDEEQQTDGYEDNSLSQVSWNLSAGIVEEIQYLLSQATLNYNNGKVINAFFYLYSSKLRFIQSLNYKERNSLSRIELLFRKARSGIKSHTIIFTEPKNKDHPKYNRCLKIYKILKKKDKLTHCYPISIRIIYERYNIKIMDLLNSYGYLIPTKKLYTDI